METLQLYNYFRSSTSYRVRIALHLKNIDFEYKPIHLLNNGGEQHSASYRKLNPLGGVPTLVHNGQVISQSFAIIEYLDDAFPQTYALFPNNPYEKAKVRQVCENINADLHPLQNLKVMQFLEKKHNYDQAEKNAWAQKWTTEAFTAIEKILEGTANTYCFGDQVTAADLFLVPQMFSARRFEMDLSKFPLLSRIEENCLKIESFKKSHPQQQIDSPKI